MSQANIVITVTTTSKAGALSKIIRDIGHYGLIYSGQSIDRNDHRTIMKIKCNGELHCSKERLATILEGLPEVLSVDDISLTGNIEAKEISQSLLSAQEPLSPSVLLAAEKRLSNIIGPVASYLVETASKNSRNAGELYLRLSNELNTKQERLDFVSVIKDIKSVSLKRNEPKNKKPQPADTSPGNNNKLSLETLSTAEKHLSDILGPIAGYLVENASTKSETVSQLYNHLAQELDNEEERNTFLSHIG